MSAAGRPATWTRDRALAAIRQFASAHQRSPLPADFKAGVRWGLPRLATYGRLFGTESVLKLCRLAGIDPPIVRPKSLAAMRPQALVSKAALHTRSLVPQQRYHTALQLHHIDTWLRRLGLDPATIAALTDARARTQAIKSTRALLRQHHPDLAPHAKTVFTKELLAYERLRAIPPKHWHIWALRRQHTVEGVLEWDRWGTRPLPPGYHEARLEGEHIV